MLKTNTIISRCENCNKLFVPAGRKDARYCNRIIDESDKTCSDVGSYKKYNKKAKDNPIYAAYMKAYRRNNSKTRTKKKKMTNEEFFKWSEEAARLRNDCEKGLISLDDFNVWLGNTKSSLQDKNL